MILNQLGEAVRGRDPFAIPAEVIISAGEIRQGINQGRILSQCDLPVIDRPADPTGLI